MGGIRALGLARRGSGDRAVYHLSGHRAEIERDVSGAIGGQAAGQGNRLVDAAEAHFECADEINERHRLRRRLCV